MVRLMGPLTLAGASLSVASSMAAVADAYLVSGGSGFVPVSAAAAILSGSLAAGLVVVGGKSFRSPLDGRTSDLCEVVSIDDAVMRYKNGRLGAVVELDGVDFGSRSDGEGESLAVMRAKIYRELARLGVDFKILVKRFRLPPIEVAYAGHPVLDEINRRWESRFVESAFRNRYLILLDVDKASAKGLVDGVRAVVDGAGDYSPHRLGDGDLLALLGELINGRQIVAHADKGDIGELVSVARIGFDHRSGRVLHREDGVERETAALSVVGWGENDSAHMVDGLLTLPMEMELLVSGHGLDRDALPVTLTADKRQATMLLPTSQTAAEYDEAIARVANDEDLFFTTQTTVFISGAAADVDQAIGDCRVYCRRFGHELRSESGAIEALWRCRLPGVKVDVHERRLQAINVAKLVQFDSAPSGLSECDWGKGCVRVIPTVSGAPYKLNLHKSSNGKAPAHTLVIGPTGSGKSALVAHLLGGCLSFPGLRGLVFDSGHGLLPFCKAVGDYVQVGVGYGLNPLETMEDERDEAFVNRFLRTLAGVEGHEAYELAQRAIEAIRDLPGSRRSLASCMNSAFQASELRNGLRRWGAADGLGLLFNGRDQLSFSGTLTGFAMDELYDQPEAVAATVDYIVHRVKKQLRGGQPFVIFVDEARRLLRNRTFQTIADEWLLELRKARGAVLLAFQSPKHVFDLDIAPTVLESCPTKILLPNKDARWEDYEALGVTQSQFARLSKPVRGEWWALVLKSGESVALDVNLSCLGPMLKLYAGGPEETLEINRLMAEHGEDWIWQYVRD